MEGIPSLAAIQEADQLEQQNMNSGVRAWEQERTTMAQNAKQKLTDDFNKEQAERKRIYEEKLARQVSQDSENEVANRQTFLRELEAKRQEIAAEQKRANQPMVDRIVRHHFFVGTRDAANQFITPLLDQMLTEIQVDEILASYTNSRELMQLNQQLVQALHLNTANKQKRTQILTDRSLIGTLYGQFLAFRESMGSLANEIRTSTQAVSSFVFSAPAITAQSTLKECAPYVQQEETFQNWLKNAISAWNQYTNSNNEQYVLFDFPAMQANQDSQIGSCALCSRQIAKLLNMLSEFHIIKIKKAKYQQVIARLCIPIPDNLKANLNFEIPPRWTLSSLGSTLIQFASNQQELILEQGNRLEQKMDQGFARIDAQFARTHPWNQQIVETLWDLALGGAIPANFPNVEAQQSRLDALIRVDWDLVSSRLYQVYPNQPEALGPLCKSKMILMIKRIPVVGAQ